MTSFDTNGDTICRKHYEDLASDCLHRGLCLAEVARTAARYSRAVGDQIVLPTLAYQPTGVALGCPLPVGILTEKVRSWVKEAEGEIERLSGATEPVLSLVPPESYHVTIVNRSHFDESPEEHVVSEEGRLSIDEHLVVQRVVSESQCQNIKINFDGWLLTPYGRLLLRGFPSDGRFYELRAKLAHQLPQLRINLPRTAHIKLAHLRVALEHPALGALLRWLGREPIPDLSVEFHDVHTPVGRIGL